MDHHQFTANGKTFDCVIDDETVTLTNAADATDVRTFPLKAPEAGVEWFPGTDDYNNCMRGCYNLAHGSPLEFAQCLADCCCG